MIYEAKVIRQNENGYYLVQMERYLNEGSLHISAQHTIDTQVSGKDMLIIVGERYRFDAWAAMNSSGGTMIVENAELLE